MVGACAFSSLAAMPDWLNSDNGKAFCRAYARARRYMASQPAAQIAASQKPLFPGIDEAVLTQCIRAYQEMGCWPADMAISEEGYNAMLDIFAFDQKITKRHAYEAICFRET